MGEPVYHIEFGVMSAPLIEQLEGQGITICDRDELARIEIIARAVSTVTIHGLMSHSASDRARKKLAKRLWKNIRFPPAPDTMEGE